MVKLDEVVMGTSLRYIRNPAASYRWRDYRWIPNRIWSACPHSINVIVSRSDIESCLHYTGILKHEPRV